MASGIEVDPRLEEGYLSHVGVKGMKWGVRNDKRPAGTPRRGPSNETLKNLGKELAYGSLGPAAVLAGLGPPVSIAIGVSVGVLRQPAVKSAIAKTSKAQSELIKDLSRTKMSAMREAREARENIEGATNITRKKVAAAGAAAAAAAAGAGTITYS